MIKIVNEKIPPAYTDYHNIYISSFLNSKEKEVAIFHEEGHIRLRHFDRMKMINVENKALWNIACDIEIAAILYPIYDYNSFIKNLPKRSLLHNGIALPLEQKEFKNITTDMTAEEIYEELIKAQEEIFKNLKDLLSDALQEIEKSLSTKEKLQENKNDQTNSMPVKTIIKQAIEDTLKEKEKKEKQENNLAQFFDAIKPKDYKLNNAIEKELKALKNTTLSFRKSYSSPSRRLQAKECSRGTRTALKPAKVAVFVDCSGSFNEEKTRNAEQALYEIEQQYRGSLKINKFYFSNKVGKTRAEACEGQNTNYQQVFREIKNIAPALSIIITDNDGCAKPEVSLSNLKVKCEIIGCDYDSAPITKYFD